MMLSPNPHLLVQLMHHDGKLIELLCDLLSFCKGFEDLELKTCQYKCLRVFLYMTLIAFNC